MRRLFNNRKHWRDRAAEARIRAAQMPEPEAKHVLLNIAEGYDRLAELVGARKETAQISN
jgi:hypothetical protein